MFARLQERQFSRRLMVQSLVGCASHRSKRALSVTTVAGKHFFFRHPCMNMVMSSGMSVFTSMSPSCASNVIVVFYSGSHEDRQGCK